LIDTMLRQDLDAPKRQRYTARRILARLVNEHGMEMISYSTGARLHCEAPPEDCCQGGANFVVAAVKDIPRRRALSDHSRGAQPFETAHRP